MFFRGLVSVSIRFFLLGFTGFRSFLFLVSNGKTESSTANHLRPSGNRVFLFFII